ncbi:hypothetical protein NE237_001161 [Protea cynaroides]|uniref:Uncharacterized protein n=1 Tax=Protea cynaroides TaxID=273540 RepID=A0A9Q0KST5_9MAGN|nr:hypothetical protein NE237_001161 [Protea cynaroides]
MLIPLPHASDVASSLSNRFFPPCRYSYLVDPLSPLSTRQSSTKNCTRPFICHPPPPRTIMVLGTSTRLMCEWESCTGRSLGRGGQPHHKIHYFFRHNWEGVLPATGTTGVLAWRGRFFGALIRRSHNLCNGLDFYETTCEQSHSHESEWVRVNHRKGGDGDVLFQPGWTDLLKGLPLNKGDMLTFQCEGGVIIVVTTPHSMTGYEKVGSCGLLAV